MGTLPDVSSDYCQRCFVMALYLWDRLDLPLLQIERAGPQFAQEDVLYLAPIPQHTVTLGTANKGELASVLRDLQSDSAARSTFEVEAMMSHDNISPGPKMVHPEGQIL